MSHPVSFRARRGSDPGPPTPVGTTPANSTNPHLALTKHSTRGRRRRRRASAPVARYLAAIITTASLALLAGCGGSPAGHVAQVGSTTTHSGSTSTSPAGSSNAGGPTGPQPGNSQKALAFSQCMRSHGVPKFPDPSSSNEMPSGLPKVAPQELGVTSSQLQAAENACRQLLPSGVQPTQQTLGHLLDFAHCMRSQGVANWPDPIPVSAQAPPGAPPYIFDLHGLQGLDTRSFSPQITTAMNGCFRLTHLTDSEVPWSG